MGNAFFFCNPYFFEPSSGCTGACPTPPRKILKSRCSEMAFPALRAMFHYFSKLHNYSLFKWRKSMINVFEIVILSDTVNLSHYHGLIQRPDHPSFGWVGRTYDGLLIWTAGIPSTVKKNKKWTKNRLRKNTFARTIRERSDQGGKYRVADSTARSKQL